MSEILRRSQVERLTIIDTLLTKLLAEVRDGHLEQGALQQAVYCQAELNRLVFRMNEIANKEEP